MNAKVDSTATNVTTSGDIVKYALALLLVAAGVFAFYWFTQWPAPVRGLLAGAGAVAGLAVFALSGKGRRSREYLGEARFELRKVVWPTRQEAFKATMVVFVAVAILTVIIGIIDFFISSGMRWLLGN